MPSFEPPARPDEFVHRIRAFRVAREEASDGGGAAAIANISSRLEAMQTMFENMQSAQHAERAEAERAAKAEARLRAHCVETQLEGVPSPSSRQLI